MSRSFLWPSVDSLDAIFAQVFISHVLRRLSWRLDNSTQRLSHSATMAFLRQVTFPGWVAKEEADGHSRAQLKSLCVCDFGSLIRIFDDLWACGDSLKDAMGIYGNCVLWRAFPQPAGRSKNVDTSKFYKLLEVDKCLGDTENAWKKNGTGKRDVHFRVWTMWNLVHSCFLPIPSC